MVLHTRVDDRMLLRSEADIFDESLTLLIFLQRTL